LFKALKKLIPDNIKSSIKSFYRYLKSYTFWGTKYKCPFCGGHFRKLLFWGLDRPILNDIVGAGRREVMCPRCYSTDRERLVFFYIKKKTDLLDGNSRVRLLHISPEMNLEKVFEGNRYIDYLTADLNPQNVMVKMDITQIQYPDESFDFIICNHVLEHIEEDGRAMSELFRVLSTGGRAILQVPLSRTLTATKEDKRIQTPKEREREYGQKDHVRIYSKIDYLRRLKNSGFNVEIYKATDLLEEKEINKYALNPEEDVIVCYK